MNLQPPVLETGALPIELRPSVQRWRLYPRPQAPHRRPDSIATVPLAALFCGITLVFALITVWSAEAHKWPIALAAAGLAAWMATLAWAGIRKGRL